MLRAGKEPPLTLKAQIAVDGRGAALEELSSRFADAFRELEFDVQVRRDEMPRGAFEISFLPLYVTVTLLLVPFFQALASKAGDDAYAWLKKVIKGAVTVEEDRLREVADPKDVPEGLTAKAARLSESGALRFQDAKSPVTFTLDLRLPDVALRRLAEIDWAALVETKPTWQESVQLRWNPDDESWWIALFNRQAPLAGAVLDVDERDFESVVINATKPILVHFWAAWAEPCRPLAKLLSELARERTDVAIAQVNVDEQPVLAGHFGIMAVPTLVLFKHGQAVRAIVGHRPRSEVLSQIESMLST
jgi:thioredoxin 1